MFISYNVSIYNSTMRQIATAPNSYICTRFIHVPFAYEGRAWIPTGSEFPSTWFSHGTPTWFSYILTGLQYRRTVEVFLQTSESSLLATCVFILQTGLEDFAYVSFNALSSASFVAKLTRTTFTSRDSPVREYFRTCHRFTKYLNDSNWIEVRRRNIPVPLYLYEYLKVSKHTMSVN